MSIVGLSLNEAFLDLGEGAAGYPVAGLVDRYREAHATFRQAQTHVEPLFPGATETIAALAGRADVVLGIATGKSRRGVDGVLARHDLRRHFRSIKTADDAPSIAGTESDSPAVAGLDIHEEVRRAVEEARAEIANASAAGERVEPEPSIISDSVGEPEAPGRTVIAASASQS